MKTKCKVIEAGNAKRKSRNQMQRRNKNQMKPPPLRPPLSLLAPSLSRPTLFRLRSLDKLPIHLPMLFQQNHQVPENDRHHDLTKELRGRRETRLDEVPSRFGEVNVG